ncbi:extracellular matrix protein 1 [Salarias fasciatus]|uniref:extracellular matrix protein 1 n=1 Tax=Salarias fasciatus TaxID=181472 RepID=UPI001176F639|nr:extracellular matrix protein 1-like [Salarias fasciatus]
MTSAGGLTGFWVIALMTLHSANLGESKPYSLNEPDVPFPPAYPTAGNLFAICHQGQGRPRYPDSFFPTSGASHFRRRGIAINRMESWFNFCCSGVPAQENSKILCCAQQAWKRALSMFCTAEYSTMTLVYECCEAKGEDRWRCFSEFPINPGYFSMPGYTAPGVLVDNRLFTFNSQTC